MGNAYRTEHGLYYPVSAVAKRLGVSRQRMYQWIQQYPPKHTTQSAYGVMISEEDVDRYLTMRRGARFKKGQG
jgi:transposase-like protein